MSINLDNNFSQEYQNLADFGARRVLGINGSLTSYINTGNAYGVDSFTPIQNAKKDDKNTKKKPRSCILPALLSCGFLIASLTTMILRGKKIKPKEVLSDFGKKISSGFNNCIDKIKNIFVKKS